MSKSQGKRNINDKYEIEKGSKALIVDGSGNGYLKTVCDYVHLNPARARLLNPEQPLRAYGWSSWPEYLKRPGKRWSWLRVERLLGEYRIPQDRAAGRRVLEQAVVKEQEEKARQAAALLPSVEVLEKIQRYETKLERQIFRAMAQLERLQRMRKGETLPAPLAVVSDRL